MEIHQLWVSSFFWKCFKYNIDFKNGKKIPEKVFCFCDNCIWIGCFKLSLLRREYFSSTVNVLTSSLKILPITKRDFSLLSCLHSYQKICQSSCRSDSDSVWHRLPSSLWKGPPKQDFLDNYLTTFFGFRNFRNTSAIRGIFFFLKCSRFNIPSEMKKKFVKTFFVVVIIASELVALNCLC